MFREQLQKRPIPTPAAGRNALLTDSDLLALLPMGAPSTRRPVVEVATLRLETSSSRVRTQLCRLSQQQRELLCELMQRVHWAHPDNSLAGTLLLKAATSRTLDLGLGKDTAWDVLRRFAGVIEASPTFLLNAYDFGRPTHEVLSPIDPLRLDQRRGVVQAPASTRSYAGLFQKYRESCGPTTIQTMLCSLDHVRAWAVVHHGMTSDDMNTPVAEFQRTLLAQVGCSALGQRLAFDRIRLGNALGRLKARGEVTRAQMDALVAYARGEGMWNPRANKAWQAVIKRYGFPSRTDLDEMTRNPRREGDGISSADLLTLLHAHVAPITQCLYEVLDDFEPNTLNASLNRAARALRQGYQVPFGVAVGEHWLLFVAVRGYRQQRQWCVADSRSGKTRWVTDASLRSGRFSARIFGLVPQHATDHIDAIIVPRSIT